jgi:hypothetical protein
MREVAGSSPAATTTRLAADSQEVISRSSMIGQINDDGQSDFQVESTQSKGDGTNCSKSVVWFA